MNEMIDSHHHLWRYNDREYGWITPEMSTLQRDFLPPDVKVAMADAGISGSIAVQARQCMAETRFLLECAESEPAIQGVVGWLPIAAPEFLGLLEEFRKRPKFKGLRHVIQDEPDDDFILGEEFNTGIASMLGTGLVYEILIHERHLSRAVRFVRRHPQQIFVLDHLAKPKIPLKRLEPWKTELTALAAYGNVFCKISGLATEADWQTWNLDELRPYLDAAVATFGAKRLMAGSDWPVCLVASSYKRWWDTLRDWSEHLSAEDRNAILGGTAKRVYRLES